jgi:hypothetical protein
MMVHGTALMVADQSRSAQGQVHFINTLQEHLKLVTTAVVSPSSNGDGELRDGARRRLSGLP